ncbi:hypothetical protein HMPREF1624_07791 [Sporothrix schenckii ATCC 58251]|uniref:Uncharacterized protein n=1 Tax=Sporothrix schenckii (strain ATCC 58251 / de Perez 2211183) TaxID=1391915 RepID=U7PLA4_SPOS1|nr:hypothetical protein HMPREF1624_07791 [Sporothrix schenckii ATCC 58251]
MASVKRIETRAPAVTQVTTPSAAASSVAAAIPSAVEPKVDLATKADAAASADTVTVPVDAEHSITLQCTLCPKNPAFSDASHLLTHISSKAHLQQLFNVGLKAKTDTAAKDKLEKFEKWYADNDIQRLLAERMSSKSKGKAAPRRSRAAATPAKPRSASAIEHVKNDTDGASAHRTPTLLPPLAHWNTAPSGRDNAYSSGRDMHYLNGTLYNTPTPTIPRSGSHAGYAEESGIAMESNPGSRGDNYSVAPPSEADSSFEANKLKGIIWPGMDLFDSATPDQKKKRNQRKDDNAIDVLKTASLNITPTEQVWGPQLEIRKERDLYTSPSSNEGTPPNTPPTRKRKSRARNSAQSDLTPLGMMKVEDGQGGPPSKRRNVRASGSRTTSKARATRPLARAADKARDKTTAGPRETSAEIEEAVYALSNHNPKPRSAFNVYYEQSHTQGNFVLDYADDGDLFDPLLNNRPALQQLDSNLSITDGSPYFKHSTSSSQFFNNGRQSPHLPPYQSTQPTAYGNGYQGMSNNTLSSLYTQPRSGTSSLYPPFDSQMFSGNSGSTTDGTTGTFHAPDNRRVGYGGFSMEPTGSPFGYTDQRDGSLRNTNYADPTLPGPDRLFEL